MILSDALMFRRLTIPGPGPLAVRCKFRPYPLLLAASRAWRSARSPWEISEHRGTNPHQGRSQPTAFVIPSARGSAHDLLRRYKTCLPPKTGWRTESQTGTWALQRRLPKLSVRLLSDYAR